MFRLHKNNKNVQERLGTEPKEPDQALEFAIAFEEGVKRQKAYGAQAPDSTKTVVKCEPVYAVERTNPRECYKCGTANFMMEHVNFCMANNPQCKNCKLVGHVEKCYNKKVPQKQKKMMQQLKNRNIEKSLRRVNFIEELDEESEEDDEAQLVLRVNGDGCKPFYMEGTMRGIHCKANTDTGSPASIFTKRK